MLIHLNWQMTVLIDFGWYIDMDEMGWTSEPIYFFFTE
jgi:hypothetical protein